MKRKLYKVITLVLLFVVGFLFYGFEETSAEKQVEEKVDDLFMIVTKGEYDREEAFKMIERVQRIPPDLYNGLIEEGIVFKLINFPMTELVDFIHLKGVVPRGYEGTGRTWDDVVGGGGPVTFGIIGRSDPVEGVHSSINLELHEVAHPIDFYVLDDISQSNEFLRIHREEQQHFLADDYNAFPEEYFAESFAYYYLSIETHEELKEKAPKTYAFIQNLGEPISKDNLKTTIDRAMALDDSKLESEYQEVFKLAQSTMENPIATQIEVDEADEKLALLTASYIAEKENQRNLMFAAIIIGTLSLGIFLLFYLRKRKNKLKKEQNH
ncbi:anthrax toxin lethal factor-related metalloendopeptidase [Oceanobacillus sp. CAU 1775]